MNLYGFRIDPRTIRVITVIAITTIARINGIKIKSRRHKQLRKIIHKTKENQQVRLTNRQIKLCDEIGVGLPYLIRYDSKINTKLKILIDIGATSCYNRTGIHKNKNERSIYKRVSTVNGYSINKYYHVITIFNTRYTFYEIDGLKSDFLICYNLLKKKEL